MSSGFLVLSFLLAMGGTDISQDAAKRGNKNKAALLQLGATLPFVYLIYQSFGWMVVTQAITFGVIAVTCIVYLYGHLYRQNRPSASGLDPEGEGRPLQ